MRDREPSASRVESLLAGRPLMSWINVGYVAYVAERERDRAASEGVVEFLRQTLTLELPSAEIVLQAAALKAVHAISYADCFAVAMAIAHDAVLLTGDPEILNADPSWPVESP